MMVTTPAANVSDGEEQNPALGPVTLIVLTAFCPLKMTNMNRFILTKESSNITLFWLVLKLKGIF